MSEKSKCDGVNLRGKLVLQEWSAGKWNNIDFAEDTKAGYEEICAKRDELLSKLRKILRRRAENYVRIEKFN